jgi:hypothetical protein
MKSKWESKIKRLRKLLHKRKKKKRNTKYKNRYHPRQLKRLKEKSLLEEQLSLVEILSKVLRKIYGLIERMM